MFSRRIATAGILLSLAMAIAAPSFALKERTEEGFPLTFSEQRKILSEPLVAHEEHIVTFEVTNPTDETIEYFLKSSSRNAHVTHKHIELAPGETGEFEVKIKARVAGPFRYRIGVVVEPTRGAVFIEGEIAEAP